MYKLLAILCLLPRVCYGQKEGTGIDTGLPYLLIQGVYNYVEDLPTPLFDLKKYIAAHIKYSKDANKEGIQGRVVLRFIVSRSGQIRDIEIVRRLYPSLDSEAVRILAQMPAWKPGTKDGKPVDVMYTCPVTFTLPDSE
jgi:TonB family protein